MQAYKLNVLSVMVFDKGLWTVVTTRNIQFFTHISFREAYAFYLVVEINHVQLTGSLRESSVYFL